MSLSAKRRIALTELSMADSFSDCLEMAVLGAAHSNISATSESSVAMGIESPSCRWDSDSDFLFSGFNSATVVREFESRQGIPDFVFALMNSEDADCIESLCLLAQVGPYAAPLIFDALLDRKGHQYAELSRMTGLSASTIRKCVDQMVSISMAVKEGDCIRLSDAWQMPRLNFFAFELKLHDWKRALFQSCQSQAFASSTIVVLPLEAKESVLKKLDWFERSNVGLLFFDAETWEFHLAHLAKPQEPASMTHYFAAALKFALVFMNSRALEPGNVTTSVGRPSKSKRSGELAWNLEKNKFVASVG